MIRNRTTTANLGTPEIEEMFQTLGQVTVRRLFGGKGIYNRGVIIAVEIDGDLRLKADAISAPEFEAAGATQWSYKSHRGAALMPYWSVPSEAFDDPDIMARWVRLALDAAMRSGTVKAGTDRSI